MPRVPQPLLIVFNNFRFLALMSKKPTGLPLLAIMTKRMAQQAPHSLAANTRAAKLLATLVASGVIKKGDKAANWYKHKKYASESQILHVEKFRKRFKKLLDAKYGKNDSAAKGEVAFYFIASGYMQNIVLTHLL